jgi:PAS domain S-box-containing protein
MIWLYNPYVIPLAGAMAVCLGLVFIAGRYRNAPGSVYFILLMLAMAGWTAMYGLELGVIGLAGKRFWAQAQYLAIPYVPVFWLAFLLCYSGRENWLTRQRMAAALLIPGITSLLAVTANGHTLVIRSAEIVREGSIDILARTFGPWFWVHSMYCYLLLGGGCLLIAFSFNRLPQWYWGQRGLLLSSCLIPWAGNLIYLAGWNVLGAKVDPTPFLFVLSVILLGWSVFYGRLFDVIPIGHDAVVRNLPDSVIILDRRDRVVEINPAACRLLGETANKILGRPAGVVLGPCRHLVNRGKASAEILEDVKLDLDNGRQGFFHIRIAPIRRHGRLVARLIILQDVTDSKHAQDDRLDSEKLKAALEMAGTVCHKLNQPIQGISGYAELVMLKMDPEDPLYPKLAGIHAQAEKMGAITNKLMGITRYRTARYTSGETILDIDTSSLPEDN